MKLYIFRCGKMRNFSISIYNFCYKYQLDLAQVAMLTELKHISYCWNYYNLSIKNCNSLLHDPGLYVKWENINWNRGRNQSKVYKKCQSQKNIWGIVIETNSSKAQGPNIWHSRIVRLPLCIRNFKKVQLKESRKGNFKITYLSYMLRVFQLCFHLNVQSRLKSGNFKKELVVFYAFYTNFLL